MRQAAFRGFEDAQATFVHDAPRFEPSTRRRLSAPGMRTFLTVAA